MDIKKFSFILCALLLAIGKVMANDRSQRLQALIDAYSSTPGTQLVIDLTSKNVSGEIDETVYVRNKCNIKFINGTLKSACTPMIEVDGESKLEVGNGVTILGIGFGDAFHVKNGTLLASTGSIIKPNNYSAPQKAKGTNTRRVTPPMFSFNKLITLMEDEANFTLNGGTINGELTMDDKHVNVVIQKGSIETIQGSYSGDNTSGKPSVRVNGGIVNQIGDDYGDFYANLYISGGEVESIVTYGSVRVSGTAEVQNLKQMSNDTGATPKCQFMGGRVHLVQTDFNAWIKDNARVDSLSLPVKDTYLMCWGALNYDICLGVVGRIGGDAIAKGVSTLTAYREDFDYTGAADSYYKHDLTASDKSHIKAYTNEDRIDGTGITTWSTSSWVPCHLYPQATELTDNTVILKRTTQAVAEAYAVYTTDGTLTFYYDNSKNSRTGTKYTIASKYSSDSMPTWSNNQSIKKVVFNSSFANYYPTSTAYWFFYLYELETITGTNYLKTNDVTDMYGMFSGCSSLTSLDLSSFNTSKVTSMNSMFWSCRSLTSLDLSSFNTSKVTNMSGMFGNCERLTSLDLSSFNTSNVTDMSCMFSNCKSLTSLDLSSFNTSMVTGMGGMFLNCTSLKTIYANSNWNTTNLNSSSVMFQNCTKLVGGAGTKYNASHVDKAYAHIDGGVSNPGYLTDIKAFSDVPSVEVGGTHITESFYNLYGREIRHPKTGVYIMRTNGKSRKVCVK